MGCRMRFVARVVFIYHLRLYFVAFSMSLSIFTLFKQLGDSNNHVVQYLKKNGDSVYNTFTACE